MFKYLNHLVISKFVMAITGLYLGVFITGHVIGNLQIFIGRDTFNSYAAFLQSLGEILWVERIILILSLILHIITSVYLKLYNNQVKPQKYAVTNYLKAKLNSRSMIWTGIMIGCFLIFHILHFTTRDIKPEFKEYKEMYSVAKVIPTNLNINIPYEQGIDVMKVRHDTYQMVINGFKDPIVSVFYIIAVILLGVHISHAMQSMFQTLGLNGPRFTPFIIKFSIFYGAIIALAYSSIPISVLLGILGGTQ